MPSKLLTQLEFYFSDANLRRDVFIQKQLKATEGGEGMVLLDVLLTFNRVKQFLGLATTSTSEEVQTAENRAALAKVIEESSALKLNDDKTAVGRVEAYVAPDTKTKEDPKRVVVVENFATDAKVEQVQEFFEKTLGSELAYVQLKRTKNSESGEYEFNGVIHIELKTEEAANKFAERKEPLKYKDKPLKLQLLEKKHQESQTQPAELKGLISLKGILGKLSREDIKGACEDDRIWVHYNRGDAEAVIEYDTVELAKAGLVVLKKNMTSLEEKVKEATKEEKDVEVKLEASLPEGDTYKEVVRGLRRNQSRKRKGQGKDRNSKKSRGS